MTHFSKSRPFTKSFVWFVCLPLLGGLTGCSKSFIGASVDAINDNFRGPSYDDYDTSELYAFNTSVMFVADLGAGSDALGSRSLVNPAMLLASANNLPGPTAPPDKSAFLSHVSFLYGGQLIGKGSSYNDGFGASISRRTYLEGIGYALYNYDLPNDKGRIFGGLGPFLGVGLFGTNKYEQAKFATQSFGAFDSNNGGYSRFDAGLAFTAGYQLPQGLRLSIAHEMGLVNIDPSGGADKTFTRVWSLNVAYPFKKLIGLVKKK
jgi:hypothetical protein